MRIHNAGNILLFDILVKGNNSVYKFFHQSAALIDLGVELMFHDTLPPYMGYRCVRLTFFMEYCNIGIIFM